jgi:hypothetical protein
MKFGIEHEGSCFGMGKASKRCRKVGPRNGLGAEGLATPVRNWKDGAVDERHA